MGKRKRPGMDDPRGVYQNALPWMSNVAHKTSSNVTHKSSSNSAYDDLKGWPPLPEIVDDSIRASVFTHQGVLHARQNLEPNASYERLEFLGDAYVQIFSSKLIFTQFPMMDPGPMTELRSRLVRNETLAGFALTYKLDKQAKIPTVLDNAQARIKILGDVFEAYVAGVIVSDPNHGEERAEKWLRNLWMPVLASFNKTVRPSNSDRLAKETLAKTIGGRGVIIDYKDARPPIKVKGRPDRYFIGVYLTGWGSNALHLGTGEGDNKATAGQLAAAAALKNPLLENVSRIKLEHDARVREEVTEEAAASGRTYEEQIQWNRARNKAMKESKT